MRRGKKRRSQANDDDRPKKRAKLTGPSHFHNFLAEIASKRSSEPTPSEFDFITSRVRPICAPPTEEEIRGVVYWMSRDQRVDDNWAFIAAQRLALEQDVPLRVVFCLVPSFLGATFRHYDFMLKGLKEVESQCHTLNIPFEIVRGLAKDVLLDHLEAQPERPNVIFCDMSPVRVSKSWVQSISEQIVERNQSDDSPAFQLFQVDAHNIVPVWVASNKQEYAARTIRRKINGKLDEFLTEFPAIIRHPHNDLIFDEEQRIDWDALYDWLTVDMSVGAVDWAVGGNRAGMEQLHKFLFGGNLALFAGKRNDPLLSVCSGLSPWLHFGQVSAQRAALEASCLRSKYSESVASFLEELIVRRELSDNFCWFNENYDQIRGAPDWARKSLKLHWKDKREYLYTRDELEESKTHDDLWNAAQKQMVVEGKMHGFLRMYWAKKILEWTENPEQALEYSIYLNDRYELDGRDPNGFVGCMWSICGVHDQGWRERPVFGKIRFMNYAGCKRKFDVAGFVNKMKRI